MRLGSVTRQAATIPILAPDVSFTDQSYNLETGSARLGHLFQGELLGFDRTRSISTQAAQTHGQEHNITALTLTFAPAEALHA